MAAAPTSVRIRSYQVGFGDCYLLTFGYPAGKSRHVLIDFGTTGLPPRGKTGAALKPSAHMPVVAQHIADTCKKDLVAVVATHRHADHISGFGTEDGTGQSGTIIKKLKPKVVLQPWTEDPAAARDATKATVDSVRTKKSFVVGLRSMHEIAKAVYALTQDAPRWMSASLRKELAFLGEDNIANESAVKNLIDMGRAPGATAVFAHHGSTSGLGKVLPGVKVRVLGPPNLEQTEKIRKQRKTDPDEFWHLLAAPPSARVASPLALGAGARSKTGSNGVPPDARWFRDRLQREHGDALLQIVRELDKAMNNTSLILLFEVGGKKLLFPGDAQYENWNYALRDAADFEATGKLLANVDVYKVGHHGSLNATPKTLLWNAFKKRSQPGAKRLKTLLSTLPNKHGKKSSKTEVPRKTLLDALETESELTNTDEYERGKDFELFRDVDVPL